jgi:hypothetical protein
MKARISAAAMQRRKPRMIVIVAIDCVMPVFDNLAV